MNTRNAYSVAHKSKSQPIPRIKGRLPPPKIAIRMWTRRDDAQALRAWNSLRASPYSTLRTLALTQAGIQAQTQAKAQGRYTGLAYLCGTCSWESTKARYCLDVGFSGDFGGELCHSGMTTVCGGCWDGGAGHNSTTTKPVASIPRKTPSPNATGSA
jgi:hypothetical protein